jgi:CO/xanthine dehydrogenase FAD-binding subunit
VAVNASDIAPALIALGAKIKTTRRTIPAEDFFAALPFKTTALEDGELVREIEFPAQKTKTHQGYFKFRIRNSIDFPIVGLASQLESSGGKFTNARVAVGAVAPTPLRLKAVEAFLKGKASNEETAAAAGELAVRDIQPLGKNRYKAQIVKALLKQAILAAGSGGRRA